MHSCPACGQACYCSGDIEDHCTEAFEGTAEHCECPDSADCMANEDVFGDFDEFGFPDDEGAATAPGQVASCIGCGCDDHHACNGGCWWLHVDYEVGLGVCSQCEEHVEAWERGDRTSHAQPATEAEIDQRQYNGRELRFEQPRPPGWSLAKCAHDWPYPEPQWGDACRWCGMSFARHVFTECP